MNQTGMQHKLHPMSCHFPHQMPSLHPCERKQGFLQQNRTLGAVLRALCFVHQPELGVLPPGSLLMCICTGFNKGEKQGEGENVALKNRCNAYKCLTGPL